MRKIGIIGGMGQHAGFDLALKIANNTLVSCDQDHVPIVVASLPNEIASRTEYLESGFTASDPKSGITQAVKILVDADATLVGMACNTAHAPSIVGPLKSAASNQQIEFLSIIDTCVKYIVRTFDSDATVGLLATSATRELGLYQKALEAEGINCVLPSGETQTLVNDGAINDPAFGIKAVTNPPTERAVSICEDAVMELKKQGASAVILGCTELPLALPQRNLHEVALIDPTTELARSLIRAYDPQKLRPR